MHGDKPYLVFEYLRGQTLRQWLDAWLGGAFEVHDSSGAFAQPPAPLAAARAVEMIVPVVRALVCAHDMGIVHRDLKPANILLTDEGVTKVLDFGVAKTGAVRAAIGIEAAVLPGEPLDLTARGARLGTLPYMSPEQIAGDLVDQRSDIWAVGISGCTTTTALKTPRTRTTRACRSAPAGTCSPATETRPAPAELRERWKSRLRLRTCRSMS